MEPSFVSEEYAVRQEFRGGEGAELPAPVVGETITVLRIWCEEGTPILAKLRPDLSHWSDDTWVQLELMSEDRKVFSISRYYRNAVSTQAALITASVTGYYFLALTIRNTTELNFRPAYALELFYTGAPERAEQVTEA